VELPALGHDEVHHDAKAPTCTEIGWDAYETCKRVGCDYTTYVELPALGHDEVQHQTKAPTCTEIGWDAYQTCSRCDYTTYVEKEALDHDRVQHAAKDKTCTEVGWYAYETCQRNGCDYTTYEEIPAKGHTYGEWTQTVAPGCETKGEERRDCVACDHFEIAEISALGHSDDDKNNICDICKMNLSNVSGGDSGSNEEPSKDDAQSIDSSTVIIAVCSIGGVGIIGGLWFFIRKRRYW